MRCQYPWAAAFDEFRGSFELRGSCSGSDFRRGSSGRRILTQVQETLKPEGGRIFHFDISFS